MESSDHIFYACETATNVWRQVRIWCDVGLLCFCSNRDCTVWLDNWHTYNDRKDKLFVIIATSLWFLWRYRNNVTFSSQTMRQRDIIDNI